MKINCPWCGVKVDNKLDKLTDHILKAHSNDVELCTWAKTERAKLIVKPATQSIAKTATKAILKYQGRPVDRISPKRQEELKLQGDKPMEKISKQIPAYLRQQLNQGNMTAIEQPPINWTRIKIGFIIACAIAFLGGFAVGFYWCWWQVA